MHGALIRRGCFVALLATVLLRAAVPAGYMPAPIGSGLLFELCPAGMPAGFLEALTDAGRHAHHAEEPAGGEHFDAEHCPIGQLLSGAAAVDSQWLNPEPPQSQPAPAAPALRLSERVRGRHSARGPPAA